MFKVESYITPIILSYVDKYIKNFRLENSQVSLWGGDASFHNLDLRLEVLEQELQLPFSFVSGHIHELLIHVPWIKLTSEPIIVTINTIECILKLKGPGDSTSTDTTSQSKEKKRTSQKQNLEAPPTYVQSLINKIVSNIRIYCNNLILKYVEEDIVLSMNVKHLKLESANDKWEPAFTDIPTGHVTLRKLIGVNDLTICLDKRNAAGKIDVYQEPMLYRCSMTMHLLKNYHSATANKASITRLDIYCNSMEFSMTEQQVPMLMRLLLLVYTLQQQELKVENENGDEALTSLTEAKDHQDSQSTWTGWAWSYVTSVLPNQWDEDLENDPTLKQKGHTLHLGFYVDEMILIFKVSDFSNDRSYYSQRKVRYVPVIALHLQGIYTECKMHGMEWFNIASGVGFVALIPVGMHCTCGTIETPEGSDPDPYLKIGAPSDSHKTDSLFDDTAVENRGKKRIYNKDWDFHMITNAESVLLEKTSAFAFDYLYNVEIPLDMTSEALSDLGSDLEYSNLCEKACVRVCIGPLNFRLCSGFLHRIDSLKVAGSIYDYPPYSIPKPVPSLHELLPPSEEDFDALSEFIPRKSIRITFLAPVLELQFIDHPIFIPKIGNLFRRQRKLSSVAEYIYLRQMEQQPFVPKLTFECQLIDITLMRPLYEKRLVYTTCQLPEPPKQLFDACYITRNIKVLSMCCKLVLNANKPTNIVVPFNASYTHKSIIKPQYWVNADIAHEEVIFESESFTLNGTKAKLMIIYYIIDKILNINSEEGSPVASSTLIVDSVKDYVMPCLELCIENIRFKKVITNSTISMDFSLGSIKGFIFEPIIKDADKEKTVGEALSTENVKNFDVFDIQQILFISGPEPKPTDNKSSTKGVFEEVPLFTATVQYPLTPELQTHPSVLIFNLQEIRICIDPLLCKWFLYTPKLMDLRKEHDVSSKSKSGSEGGGIRESRKFHTQIESVHSSSDREQVASVSLKISEPQKEESVDLQEQIYNFLKNWFNVWKGMILCGDVCQCTIYFPMESLSAVGSQGIHEAVNEAINKKPPADILIITLPLANVRSAQRQNINKYLKTLPVALPPNIWTFEKSSFPWTMSVSDLSCYTIQFGHKFNFLKPVSLSATVGLSTRPAKSDVKESTSEITLGSSSTTSTKADIGCLGVCVHIDMTPIVMSTSEVQMYLIASILYGLVEIAQNLLPEKPPLVHRHIEISPPVIKEKSSETSPTILRESTLETLSDHSPTLSSATSQGLESDSVKLTAWVQWTVTRFTIELHSSDLKNIENSEMIQQSKLKLVVDAEDIVSSLDFQSVYLKIKSKIGLVSVQHFKRKTPNVKWKPGAFSGIILRLRDDVVTSDRHEDNGFISITITRASCQHTHTLWGTLHKKKKDRRALVATQFLSPSRYITEIVVNVQPIDLVIAPKTLRSFYAIIQPLLSIPLSKSNKEKKVGLSTTYNNHNLPLAYLDCQDLRVIMPSTDLRESGAHHDVVIIQIHKITLNPSPVNPICRTPSRPDIYQQAAQARLLNIPGSEVEDRQYQFDVVGLSISTGIWDNLQTIFASSTNIISTLHGTSENPALEWNNLEKGQLSITPVLHLWQISEKVDITVVMAPAMVFKNNIIICGSSIEVNLVTDININLSLSQIRLVAGLISEFKHLLQPLDPKLYSKFNVKIPYTFIRHAGSGETEHNDVIRDSGIETSDMKSSISFRTKRYAPRSESLALPARTTTLLSNISESISNEVVFTGGRIIFTLYDCDTVSFALTRHKKKHAKPLHKMDEDQGYDASEEGSLADEVHGTQNKFVPLLYVAISQPNLYLSNYHLGDRFQISCFDIDVKISLPEYPPLNRIPTQEDFPLHVIETRSGKPHPSTGILPAFFTLKYFKGIGKSATLNVEIMKPSKVVLCLKVLNRLVFIKETILECFIQQNLYKPPTSPERQIIIQDSDTMSIGSENYRKFYHIKEFLRGINTVNFNMEQIVFALCTDNGPELNVSLGRTYSHLTICNRPERICNVFNIKCVTLCVKIGNFTKLLLNPWSLSAETCLYWESWQDSNSDPQIHLVVEADPLIVDVSQEHIKCLQLIIKEVNEFVLSILPEETQIAREKNTTAKIPLVSREREQHYKDDLRAGAFQFVSANANNTTELPLPYQVIFWTDHFSAMAWRYPQPRALTKVRIFPVPYKVTVENCDSMQVLCHLEYWSECHNMYIPYTQFFLSENEILDLKLPDGELHTVVASTWRVVLKVINEDDKFTDNNETDSDVSPRALAACMRIDSYFNSNLIPNLTVSLHVSRICVSLYTYFDKTAPLIIPDFLKSYSSDLLFPENQCFMTLSLENIQSHLSSWKFEAIVLDTIVSTKCSVIDYTFLTNQPLVELFSSKIEINYWNSLSCNFMANPISIKFCPAIAHSLAVNAQLWEQSFGKGENEERDFILMTKYIICNDTDNNLRFGQSLTDEDILLPSRYFNMYCWRSQKHKRLIKVGLEQNEWVWSQPFDIDHNGTKVIEINSANNLSLLVTVKQLSSTQKQITLSGQLVLSNMLLEHFELKVVEAVEQDKDKQFKKTPIHIIAGKSISPSMFINTEKKYFLRLRFFGLDSAWTGDIPLVKHAKGAQPWLVKVPLQERGQFLSIWCQIVEEEFPNGKKVLAMLWPLFAIRSNLPIDAKLHIETQTLNVHLDSTVRGRGELQQLYCPGTIDHSHQLTFNLENGSPTPTPYVPLNYSLVDQQEFFQKPEGERIDDIIEVLKKCDERKWPIFDDEYCSLDWITEEQPLTHVQVRYQNACLYSSTLLLELVPWCLMINVLGSPVSVLVNGVELCRLPHHGIVAPPKLEDTFNLQVSMGNTWNISNPLQLAKSDWSQSFYMPVITGSIPLNGVIKTAITSQTNICMVSLSSSFMDDMLLLKIASTHILTNYMTMQMHVICLAVPDDDKVYNFKENFQQYSFTVAPHFNKSKCGVSILQWYLLETNSDSNTDFILYMSFSLDPKSEWSCPIRVDKTLMRKSMCISDGSKSYPIVVSCQEYKGQFYVSVNHDNRPQTCIENRTDITLFCAQSNMEGAIASESQHFTWFRELKSGTRTFYSIPFISEKFPEVQQTLLPELLVFSCRNKGFHDLKNLVIDNNLDIDALSETWLSELMLKLLKYKDFLYIRKEVVDEEEGVAGYIRNSIPFQKVIFDEPITEQLIFAKTG